MLESPMNTRCKPALRRAMLGAAALALLAGPALAHHSFAMFDTAHPGVLTGTVKQFDWTNPHAYLWVYGDAKPGETPVLWSFETSNPGNLTRAGWTKHTFQAGDKVQVRYAPVRSGAAAGQLVKTTQLSTGKSYDLTVVPPPTDPAAK
jgi:hypothetical protein